MPEKYDSTLKDFAESLKTQEDKIEEERKTKEFGKKFIDELDNLKNKKSM